MTFVKMSVVTCGFIAATIAWCPLAPSQSIKLPEFVFIAPRVVPQGESFSGAVVERTPEGDKHLREGDIVKFGGQVIEAKNGYRLDLPANTDQLGNTFYVVTVQRGSTRARSCVQHIEFVKAPKNPPCEIARTSEVASSTRPFRVVGSGLDKMKRCAMTAASGARYAVGDAVGSSLEQIYIPNENVGFPKGEMRFTAIDDKGNKVEAPSASFNPKIELSGDQVKFKGQRGEITVKSDAPTGVEITGGAPNIKLDGMRGHATPAKPAKFAFTAEIVGNYQVLARAIPTEEVPPEKSQPKADATCEKPKCEFDEAKNETTVTAETNVTQPGGKPCPSQTVQTVATTNDGIEYGTCVTDSSGKTTARFVFTGNISATDVSVHAYELPGREWIKTPTIDDGGGIPIGEEIDNKELHHCQGHRMVIVIGPDDDPAIRATLNWAYARTDIQHKLFLRSGRVTDTPSFDYPYIPEPDSETRKWVRMKTGGRERRLADWIAANSADCCHFDEILLVFHGGQTGKSTFFKERFPLILGNKPVRKAIIWSCRGSSWLFPNERGMDDWYPVLMYTLRPRNCSFSDRCDCTHENCVCFDADGRARPDHCPDGSQTTEILTAAWWGDNKQSSLLGLDPDNANPLTSPDGRMRRIRISTAPGGPKNPGAPGEPEFEYDVQSDLVTTPELFGGMRVREDAALRENTPPVNEEKTMRAIRAGKPARVRDGTYAGPKRCAHPTHEGCLINRDAESVGESRSKR